MKKNEFNQKIGSRLNQVLTSLNLSQHQLLLMCEEKGYQISQSALSKLLSGSSVQILHIAQICDVLKIDIAEVLSLSLEEVNIRKPETEKTKNLITNAKDQAFRGYLGIYHAYFYTTKNEESIHNGIFELKEDPQSHKCVADFRFKTGEKNAAGNDIEKHYSGTATCSNYMRTIYCDIKSEEIGEISYLLFHYDFLAYQDLECRIATVITVSSGIKRLPTMHKLLLTRKKLSAEELDYLCGQLRLNNSEILISENAYRGFLHDPMLPKSFFDYFGKLETEAEGFKSSVAKVTYYSFNESLLSDSFLHKEIDRIKIICLLRKYSSAPRCNKISAKAEELTYKFLQYQNNPHDKDENKA